MISVCIATYNGEKYIKEQLLSILKQLSDDDEVIVSDDGSKDNTLQVISSLEDKRLKVFHNEGRHGVVPNFENALRHVNGDYVFLSDQDDIWADNKVEVCLKYLQKYDLVVHNLLMMDGEGNVSSDDFFSNHHSKAGFWNNLKHNSFMGSCLAFRGDVLHYVLPLPRHVLWHDMWIGLMVEKKGRTIFVDEKLMYYRRHGGNASTTSCKSAFSHWFQLKYRIQMLWYSLWR